MTLFGEIEKCFPVLERKLPPDDLKRFAAARYGSMFLYSLIFMRYIHDYVFKPHPHIRVMARFKNVNDIYLLVVQLFYVYLNCKIEQEDSEKR